MPENRKALISKLKSLNPTEGEWRTYPTESYIRVITDEPRNVDDRILITLAPSMREELLKMEEEMEKMYSKDDLERAIELARDGYVTDEGFYSFDYNHDEIINQLNQPQP